MAGCGAGPIFEKNACTEVKTNMMFFENGLVKFGVGFFSKKSRLLEKLNKIL